MVDFTADHISTEEAHQLLNALQAAIQETQAKLVTGVSYRNLLIYRGSEAAPAPFTETTRTRAPHDLTDLSVLDDFPRGPGSDWLCHVMELSAQVFADHPVNIARKHAGKRPATHVWLWGQGRAPALPSFASRFQKRGAMITAVDLLRGLAALIGWDRIEVPGATGYLDTNYRGKGQAAIDALQKYDVVCVHVEATDEASHEGRVEEKIKALEAIDENIVRPIHAALEKQGDYRLMVMPDHPTPCETKKHSHGFVPFAVCGKGIVSDHAVSYDEVAAAKSAIAFPKGWDLMQELMSGSFQ